MISLVLLLVLGLVVLLRGLTLGRMTSVGFGRMIFSCQCSPATLEYMARILVPDARTAIADTKGTNRRRILLPRNRNSAADENKDNGSKADDKKVIDERRREMHHV